MSGAAKHIVPAGISGWSKGMHRVLAPAAPGAALSCFTFSSTSTSSHHGASTIFLALSAGTKSSHLVTRTIDSSNCFRARASMSVCIAARAPCTAGARSPHFTKSFFPVSRRATTQCPATRSLGPSSMRSGTPFSSQWLYFHPGVWKSRSSTCTLTPAALRAASISATTSAIFCLCSALIFELGMGMMTAWVGATRGGTTRPLLSAWIMIITPIVRVVIPQEFCQTFFCVLSSAVNSMLNILEKFWPRQWEVPPWMALPVAGMKASTVVVYRPPANFSFSDLTPFITGTHSRSS